MPLWPMDEFSSRHPYRRGDGLITVKPAKRRVAATLVVPFSRPWMVERWFERFRVVWLPENTEVVAVVDHSSRGFYEQIADNFRKMADRFAGIRIQWTQQPPAPEWSDIEHRRQRICGHWHTFLRAAEGSVILGAEDDTLPDWDAYKHLLRHVEDGASFAQGTCIARWDAGYVPHWRCVMERGQPVEWGSGFYAGERVVEIHGGGWYCFAASTEALRRIRFVPRLGPIGPDIWAIHQLHERGEKCVGDWGVHCTHVAQTMDLSPNREVIDVVTYRFSDGRWRHSISGGRAMVVDPANIQIAGSQPRPVSSRRQTRVTRITAYGSKPNTVEEWVEA